MNDVSDVVSHTGAVAPDEPTVERPAVPDGPARDRIVSEDVPLSRQIARRTTDLIAISLVLIAGLTVARRVTVWWNTEPIAMTAFPQEALAPWGQGPSGAAIGLGDRPLLLRRQLVRGSLQDALRQIRTNCREVLTAYTGRNASEVLLPVTEAETSLLEKMDQIPVVESDATAGWSIHQLDGPLAMTLGVGPTGKSGADDRRVLCWGLVFPSGESHWTALTVEPRVTGAEPWIAISLPTGVQSRMHVADEIGGGFVTFSGTGPPEVWRVHWEDEARRRQWQRLRDWRIDTDGWSAAWRESSTESSPSRRIDLQFVPSDKGWSGLLHLSPEQQQFSGQAEDVTP